MKGSGRTLMAYRLRIQREAGSPDAEPEPIPLEEWCLAVAATKGVRLLTGKVHTLRNPITNEVIKISAHEGDAEVFFPDDGQWHSVFSWFEGSSSFVARLEPGDTSHPVWVAAVSLAACLGAVICGDDGEIYDLQTGQVIDP